MSDRTSQDDRHVRFHRTHMLLGDAAMERLAQSFVVIVGLGAVGGTAAEALARSGVGRFRFVDFDTIHPSNINRQPFALESTLGLRKAEAARARVLDINPSARVDALPVFVDGTTIGDVLAGAPNLVLDAIDSVNPKVLLISQTLARGIPVISSMGAARKRDASRIAAADIAETSGCRLARMIRKKLFKLGIDKGLRCVYSDEPTLDAIDWNVDEAPAIDRRGRKRATMGSLTTITGMFGLRLAHEALAMLLAKPSA